MGIVPGQIIIMGVIEVNPGYGITGHIIVCQIVMVALLCEAYPCILLSSGGIVREI